MLRNSLRQSAKSNATAIEDTDHRKQPCFRISYSTFSSNGYQYSTSLTKCDGKRLIIHTFCRKKIHRTAQSSYFLSVYSGCMIRVEQMLALTVLTNPTSILSSLQLLNRAISKQGNNESCNNKQKSRNLEDLEERRVSRTSAPRNRVWRVTFLATPEFRVRGTIGCVLVEASLTTIAVTVVGNDMG